MYTAFLIIARSKILFEFCTEIFMPERNIKVICSMTMCEMVAYINDSVFMTILSVTMKIRL